MLDSRTVTLENAAGAVMTNCVFGAYAVGDIKDIAGALTGNIHIKKEFEPDPAIHAFYQKQYELKNRLVKEEMGTAFLTLKQMREDSH